MPRTDARATGDGDVPIRNAACLILVDRTERDPRLLMGRRLPTQVFLPNKWVFPGGRVDDDDHTLASQYKAIVRPTTEPSGAAPASDPRHLPFAWAAVRETYEEAGILITDGAPANPATLPPTWQAFGNLGVMPTIDRLRPLARAVTPPGLPRRFDTWFYIADWEAGQKPTGTPDGELLDLGWFTLAQVRALDLPYITRLIVDDVAIDLSAGPSAGGAGIPFYYQAVDGYTRTLMAPAKPWPAP